jgi:LacI family transcriptional regulator
MTAEGVELRDGLENVVRRATDSIGTAISPHLVVASSTSVMSDPTIQTVPRRIRGAAPTLFDVAQEAGVSMATASRVLNGTTRRVGDGYGRRVRVAAEKLGYTANLSAQATAKGTSAVIALLVRDIADPYFSGLASGVARGADEAGLVVTISVIGANPDLEATTLRALRGQRPRAVILASSRIAEQSEAEVASELQSIAADGGRAVGIGSGMPGIRSLAIDNHGAAHELGSRIALLGYHQAVIVAGKHGLRTSDDRAAGFSAGFTRHGGSVVGTVHTDLTREGGVAAMSAELVDSPDPGTVVFGVTDVVAIGAMSAIRDAGRCIGEDIAVAGFGDIATSRDVTPPLTTVRIPLEELGYAALRAAIEDEWDANSFGLLLEIVLRGSTPSRADQFDVGEDGHLR